MHTIRYSISRDIRDKASQSEMAILNHALQPVTTTVEELMAHLQAGGPICNAFLAADENGLASRNEESFIESWIVGADIDNAVVDKNGVKRRKTAAEGYYSLDDAKRDETVRSQAAFLYTTPSHQDNWHRFRIIWVLPEPIRDQNEYRRLVSSFIEQFDSDRATSSPRQIFYGSSKGEFVWFGNVMSTYQLRIHQERTDAVAQDQREFVVKSTRDLTERDVKEMLERIPHKLDYIDWVKIISSVVAILGESAAERIIEDWSPGYDGEVRYKIVNKLQKVGPGTLIYYAKRYGWTPPPGMYSEKAKANSPEVVTRFLDSFYDWRKNTVTDAVEFSAKATNEWEPLQDYHLNSLLLDMRKSGLNVSKERLYETLDSSFSAPYHPFRDYFDSLATWDGEDRWGDLVDCLQPDMTAYESEAQFYDLARLVFSTWFRGAVYAATKHKANHIMPILQGGQGIGKTRFLMSLCPPELKAYEYVGPIKDDKDFRILMSRAIIGIDDELESMNRREMNAIKSLITQETANERGAYKRTHQNYERKISFIGSVNRRTFLNDETGSRRFPVLALTTIDMDARMGISTAALWAQAKAELDAGMRHYLNADDVALIQKLNEEFTVENDAEALLQKYFRAAPKTAPEGSLGIEAMTTTALAIEIAKRISAGSGGDVKISVNSNLTYQLGRALARLNYQRKRVNGQNLWVLRDLTKVNDASKYEFPDAPQF